MNENLKKTFEEQLTYLPAINQQALRSFDWATELIGIGKQYGLHIDQLEDLQIETMLVLVGVISADDYPNELITRLAISPSEADKIIEQINDRIFTPIHDHIVRGGPISSPISDAVIMENTGVQIIKQSPTPQYNQLSQTQSTVSEKSDPLQPIQQIQTAQPNTNPLTFNPTPTNTVVDIQIPETIIPSTEPIIISGQEKLEKLYQQRKKIIDTTLQSMDQQKPTL